MSMEEIRIPIVVPSLPESVMDGTIAKWNKKVGDPVAEGENLVDLETDKVILEIPAPKAGVLLEIVEQEGSIVKTGQILGFIAEKEVNPTKQESKLTQPSMESSKKSTSPTTGLSEKESFVQKSSTKEETPLGLSPSARRLLSEKNKDADSTKEERLLTRQDILQPLEAAHMRSAVSSVSVLESDRVEKRVPMTRLRARIAERLLAAQHNAAILTTFNEVDLHTIMQIREQYKENFEKKYAVKLGFMSLFTKAVVEALRNFPEVNASIEGNDIIYHNYFDIGIAVSTDRGLVVPIIRNADQLGLAEIEKQILEYAKKAREGQLSIEEMTGGTFTITNGGVFGSLLSTPILNPPQSAILGMHKIQDRPVAEKGQIVIRPMMYLALSYDHRIIDGKQSVQFLTTIKALLEDPIRLLLEV